MKSDVLPRERYVESLNESYDIVFSKKKKNKQTNIHISEYGKHTYVYTILIYYILIHMYMCVHMKMYHVSPISADKRELFINGGGNSE